VLITPYWKWTWASSPNISRRDLNMWHLYQKGLHKIN